MAAPETVQVRSTSGVIFEMDVPTKGHALERWDQQIARGDLVIVSGAVWQDTDGTRQLVMPQPAAETSEAGPDKEALLARAYELGVEVKGNWGAARIQAAIDAATAE